MISKLRLTSLPPLPTFPHVDRSPINPRILRLTPLDSALSRLAALTPLINPIDRPLMQAVGAVLALDVQSPVNLPLEPTAYTDGWSVNAEDLLGSSAYSAAILTPPPNWVDAGDRLQCGNSILPREAVRIVAPGVAEAAGPATPGEGVRAIGQDISTGELILPAGTRLVPRHLGILNACGFDTISVRSPRVRLIFANAAVAVHSDWVRIWLEAAGAQVVDVVLAPDGQAVLAACYSMSGADLVISVGGTGQGRNDCAIAALAEAGAVDLYGLALNPGSSAAFGHVGSMPVILVPGRFDAMIAVLLMLVERGLAAATGVKPIAGLVPSRLAEKVTSTIGFDELFLGVPFGVEIRPALLTGASFDTITRAIGWFVVPPSSEGIAAGETVHLRPF